MPLGTVATEKKKKKKSGSKNQNGTVEALPLFIWVIDIFSVVFL